MVSLLWLLLVSSNGLAVGGAQVTILNAPALLVPGQMVAVNTEFNKTPDEQEKRVVIRVDLHDSDTGAIAAGGVADNGGAGFTGTGAVVSCSVTVPANASGSYYFKATVAPWSLNRAVIDQYKTYPTDGTFPYSWDSSRRGDYGVTQEVTYLGQIICPLYPGTPTTTYCSGVAFETAVIALNKYNLAHGHSRIGSIQTVQNMQSFRKIWYGVSDAEKLGARAIPEWGAGREIIDFDEAQEGDIVQLWRNSLSGHNPLFISWVRNSSSEITGVRYWGSQGGSQGIGFRTESFGTNSSGINRARFYIARLAKPRDQADYEWALGEANTQNAPSSVGASALDWDLYN